MIVRIWHGRVPSQKAAAYRAFLNEKAIPGTSGIIDLSRYLDAGYRVLTF
jgi:hypothetical protein